MLTVLIATHNGAGTLPQVLRAYQGLTFPSNEWHLIVVDNASTDDSSSVLSHFKDSLPLEIVSTEQRGKNIALNIGLNYLKGDLVVLTDDDIVPSPDWLTRIHELALRQTAYDQFGGAIDPIWPPERPDWIERLAPLGATFGITDNEIPDGPVPASQIWGGNMAIRRSVFENGHRFDESVGPSSGQYIMGSEIDFTTRIEILGHAAWFSQSCRVGHIIRPNQVVRDWIIQRGYRLGRHMYLRERHTFPESLKLWRGSPRWQYRRLLSQIYSTIIAMLSGDFDAKFKADWEVSFLRGYLFEGARQAKARAK